MQTVVNGILTNYEVLGLKNIKTILVLHGWGQSLENWKAVAQKLSSKYRVVLLDLPGFGSSPQPDYDFGTEEYADFVDKFMTKMDLKHLTLIGHSFGGKLSIKTASSSPRVDQLILISPSGTENKSFLVILKTLLVKVAVSTLFWLPEKVIERGVQFFGSPDYKNAGRMRKTIKKILNQKVTEEAKRIAVPTLIIWGEKDSELSLKNAKTLKSLIKNSTLRVLWGIGHSPNIESPEKLTNLLLEYL